MQHDINTALIVCRECNVLLFWSVDGNDTNQSESFPILNKGVLNMYLKQTWINLKPAVIITFFFNTYYFFFQLKNAFDNLFEGLMESKDGEKEAAEVNICLSVFCHIL